MHAVSFSVMGDAILNESLDFASTRLLPILDMAYSFKDAHCFIMYYVDVIYLIFICLYNKSAMTSTYYLFSSILLLNRCVIDALDTG